GVTYVPGLLCHPCARFRPTELPWTTILAAVGLVYVVSPVDAIPDVLVPIGFVDDAAVMAGAIAALSHDLGIYARKKGLDPTEYGL
ncbi:MAG TPA: DUF1232 domain-containing protein, partial [Myxococcota bacterium]|nr:DUF1232 domain-containing protein [Myxococcota bacterium]